MDAADVAEALEALEDDYHHDGGAVGVGDDAPRAAEGVFGVAFGDDEGHVIVHAEGGGVVYHDGGSGTGEGDVDVAEVVIVLEQAHFEFLPAEGVSLSGAAGRAEET